MVSVREELKTKNRNPVLRDISFLNDMISEQIYDDRSRGEVMDVLSNASSDTTFSQSSQISSTSGYTCSSLGYVSQNFIKKTIHIFNIYEYICFRKSYRSRKKARKHARKILRVKEGNLFEDVGLIFELHKIISDIYKDRGLCKKQRNILTISRHHRTIADIRNVIYHLQTKQPNLCIY